MADLSDLISTEAASPASAASDGQSASARSIGDIIRADQYVANKAAMRKRRRGITFTRLTSPGPIDDQGGTYSPPPFGGGVS